MLETYRRLEANGVVGRLMKVDQRGTPIFDPTGEMPGTLIERPFQEFPKVIRRFKRDGSKLEIIVQSKNEELRLLAENVDEVSDIPLSPLERERNELAQQNAEQNKTIMALQSQMATMMSQMATLAQKIDQRNAEGVALTGEAVKNEDKPELDAKASATSGKGIEALVTGGSKK